MGGLTVGTCILDEIIKLNKKANKPNPKKLSVKPLALSTKRAGSLRSSIAKPMKSRQASAARAIFQRARRTAAIAAKVAADAAALVSPAVSIPNLRRGGRKFRRFIFIVQFSNLPDSHFAIISAG